MADYDERTAFEQSGDDESSAFESAPSPPPIVPPPVPAHGGIVSEHGGSAHREVTTDDHGRIDEQVDCRGCGYNLQGLPTNGLCPECSTPVERSIRGDVLQFANPTWLARVSKGLLWIIIGIFSQIGIGMLGGVGMALVMSISANQTGAPTINVPVLGIVMLLTTTAAGILVLGVWWMTTPDPASIENESTVSARRLARFCTLFLLIQGPAQMFANPNAMMMGAGATGPGPNTIVTTMIIVGVVGVIAQLVTITGHVSGLIYLRSLALRIPRMSLAKQTKIVAWGYGIANGLGVMIAGIAMAILPAMMAPVGGGAPPPALLPGIVIVAIGGCFIGVGTLMFSIWALVLLFLYRSRIAKISVIAEANWNA